MNNTISPQQRAQNFGAYTRQHIQTLGTMTAGEGGHIEFEVPKARLLQSINLLVEVEAEAAEAVTAVFDTQQQKLAVYDVLKRVSTVYNNGFSPISATGRDLAVMSMLRINPEAVMPHWMPEYSNCTIHYPELTMVDGTEIKFASDKKIKYYFRLDVPNTLNDRDTSGLFLLQNGATLVNMNIDIANTALQLGGAEYTISSVKVTPEIVSFSIPEAKEAFPNLTVLKILDSRKEAFTGGGSNLVKLPCGMIYRKILLFLEDSDGNPISPDDITSNIEILFNTADVPYSVNPRMLRLRNTKDYGASLPEGYYAFDFSVCGMPNYAGSRDYVDCEKITTCEIRFTTNKGGNVTIIAEKISRLVKA